MLQYSTILFKKLIISLGAAPCILSSDSATGYDADVELRRHYNSAHISNQLSWRRLKSFSSANFK